MGSNSKIRAEVEEVKRALAGRGVLVVGFGKSGKEAVKLLLSLGCKVTVFDDKYPEFENTAERKAFSEKGVYFVAPEGGIFDDSFFQNVDLTIQSPGVPYDHPVVTVSMINLVPVWSEIELAYQLIEKPIIGITGTNGKTTTTTLVGEILKESGIEAAVAGNIGKPLVSLVDHLNDTDIVVAEISSFQLESIVSFKPFIAAYLNLTPDHLDRHYVFQRYAEIKTMIFEKQNQEDCGILNYDDENVRAVAPTLASRVIFFSKSEELERGVFVKNRRIFSTIEGKLDICPAEIAMRGQHNLENALAAAAIALCAGASAGAIAATLKKFPGVEHRIEFVKDFGGVKFFNDSKATNPDSAVVALRSFDEPVVLIAGGKEKGTAFDEFSAEIARSCKNVVLIGEAADTIQNSLKNEGFDAIKRADSLEEAVKTASEVTEEGDVVLLSPACASFDMFDNFEERGDAFKEAVCSLTD